MSCHFICHYWLSHHDDMEGNCSFKYHIRSDFCSLVNTTKDLFSLPYNIFWLGITFYIYYIISQQTHTHTNTHIWVAVSYKKREKWGDRMKCCCCFWYSSRVYVRCQKNRGRRRGGKRKIPHLAFLSRVNKQYYVFAERKKNVCFASYVQKKILESPKYLFVRKIT